MKLRSVLPLLLILANSAYSQKSTASFYAESSRSTFEKICFVPEGPDTIRSVRVWLLEKYGKTTLPGFDLSLTSRIQSPGGTHLVFTPSLLGVPLLDQMIKVNIDRNGMIRSLGQNLSVLSVPVLPSFSDGLKVRKMLDEMGSGKSAFTYTIEKYFMSSENALRPVFVARATAFDFGAYRYIFDGTTEELLSEMDLSSYFRQTDTDTTGRGLVFNPDPLTSAGVSYGGAYVDNADADSAPLNNERDTVFLRDIDFSGGVFQLSGPHVAIVDLESPTAAPVTSASPDFFFTRAQSGFEDVNAYYHIDTFQRYLQSIGFTNLFNQTLNVDPHGLGGADNSHFVPNGSASYIALGEGCVDDAEDADVLVHEYGHCISYAAAPNTLTGNERRGMDEGIGDYMAASYSRRINNFQWHKVFSWDGHNICWPGRFANEGGTYPVASSDIYQIGEFWASVMMECNLALGDSIHDRVFFQQLYSNVPNMTLADAANQILEADSLLFGGAHTIPYLNILCQRNLITGSRCALSTAEKVSAVDVKIFPNPGREFHVQAGQHEGCMHFAVFDMLGHQLKEFELLEDNREFVFELEMPGMYLLRCTGQDGRQKSIPLVVN